MDIKKCAFVGLQNAVKKIEIWYEFDSWEKVIQKLNLKLLWENIWHLVLFTKMIIHLVVFCLYLFSYQCESRVIHRLLPSDPYKQYVGKI